MMNSNSHRRTSRGFTLIEVLIGILIFAVGMMALAKLQGNLARNSGDSNARTVATNIAEEVIERSRVFQKIESDGTNAAYNDIVDGTQTIERSGNLFTVVTDVTDYYYDADADEFSVVKPDGVGKSDFKQIDLTVTWNSGQEFQVDATNTTNGRLGSGSIRLTDVVSSMPSGSGGKANLGSAGNGSYAPPVDYSPGANPDIISIHLGTNKFKESTTPLPKVIRADQLVETTFDVVTYAQNTLGATFLRREEFRAVSCECVLRAPADGTGDGLRPTVWDGYEYTEGGKAYKPYGEAANSVQSQFCGICCRDHHDGGTGEEEDSNDPGRYHYNPFRPSDQYYNGGTFSGDHNHYDRSQTGILALADSAGDTYVEACRLIRKDGFWRVAQDLRQEGLNSFPADYLDEDSEIAAYSGYVTEAVKAYDLAIGATEGYESSPPALTLPAGMSPPMVFPASTYGMATRFEAGVTTEQQLRSRGIYLDYLSDTLRTQINCLKPGGSGGADCKATGATSPLEIIPFYDVQLTWLARWNETPTNNPIDVTNQAISDDNSHDRGRATLQAGFGYSTINSAVNKGNLGLTGTDPIDLLYSKNMGRYDLYALAVDYDSPPPLSGFFTYGEILSAVPGLRAADVEIVSIDEQAQCDRTNTGFKCAIVQGAKMPMIRVFNYFRKNMVLVACSDGLEIDSVHLHNPDTGPGNWTEFILPIEVTGNVTIVIKQDSCN